MYNYMLNLERRLYAAQDNLAHLWFTKVELDKYYDKNENVRMEFDMRIEEPVLVNELVWMFTREMKERLDLSEIIELLGKCETSQDAIRNNVEMELNEFFT